MPRISLPLEVITYRPKTARGKIKKFICNLNNYRNAPFHQLSAAKKAYTAELLPKLKSLPPMGRVHLFYTFYPPTKRRVDLMNVLSVVDKFTSDALVEAKVIEDDSTEYIDAVHCFFGEVDKENPRVELSIIRP